MPAERDMQRIAWTVLLASFSACMLLFFGTPALAYWYFNTATDPQESELTVLSGTAIVEVPGREPSGERATRKVPEGAVIRTDANTRVRLLTFDGSTLTVLPDSQVRLAAMRKASFKISSLVNQVQVDLRAGRLRLAIAGNGEPHEVHLAMPQSEAHLQDGEYLAEVVEPQSDLIVRNGQALLRARDTTVVLGARQRALIAASGSLTGPLPAQQDLLANGSFDSPLSDSWTVYNDQGGDGGTVNGTVSIVQEQGRRAVRFVRAGSNGNHIDTGIEQAIDKDVTDFESVRLRADVMVTFQSLSGGGYLSSEFPLMVRVKYLDIRGGQNFWVHGFYYQNDARNPTANSEQVPQSLWYPYESPDLPLVLNPRPARILSVQIYASGWDFDSLISDIGLIVQ